jgi:hypothetical protein
VAQRQLVHQYCGQIIQQVGIVNPDDHPGLSGTSQQRVAGLANQPSRIRADHAQRRRERAQRERPGRGRGHHPPGQRASPLRCRQRLPG